MPIVELVTGAMLPACVWQDVYVNGDPMALTQTKYIVKSQAGGLFMANYVQDGSTHVRVLGALFKLIIVVMSLYTPLHYIKSTKFILIN